MQFGTLEEFRQFLAAVSNKETSTVAFSILFFTGIRCGELLALTLNDFDMENKTLRINKSYARLGQTDILSGPKTPKSNRLISLPDFLCDMIAEYAGRLYDYNPNYRLFEVTKFYLTHEMNRGV